MVVFVTERIKGDLDHIFHRIENNEQNKDLLIENFRKGFYSKFSNIGDISETTFELIVRQGYKVLQEKESELNSIQKEILLKKYKKRMDIYKEFGEEIDLGLCKGIKFVLETLDIKLEGIND